MTDLVTQENGILSSISNERIAILKAQICKGATDIELAQFIEFCKAKGLDPFAGQIFMVKRKSKGGDVTTYQTGIDGLRSIAAQSGKLAGIDEPIYEEDGGKYPKLARVSVYRIVDGQRVAFVGVSRWDEFYPGDTQGFMWKSKPFLMLGKTAEAQALRKAFPAESGGIYASEETVKDDHVGYQSEKIDNSILPENAGSKLAPKALVDKLMKAFKALNHEESDILKELGITDKSSITVGDIEVLRHLYKENAAAK